LEARIISADCGLNAENRGGLDLPPRVRHGLVRSQLAPNIMADFAAPTQASTIRSCPSQTFRHLILTDEPPGFCACRGRHVFAGLEGGKFVCAQGGPGNRQPDARGLSGKDGRACAEYNRQHSLRRSCRSQGSASRIDGRVRPRQVSMDLFQQRPLCFENSAK